MKLTYRSAKLFALVLLMWAALPAFTLAQVASNSGVSGVPPPINVTSPTNNQCLVYQSASGTFVNASCTSGGGGGTVTSVALAAPSWLTVTNSPVTSTGTLTLTGTTGLTANQFLATPSGSTGAPSIRSIVALDIPQLTATQMPAYTGDVTSSAGGTVNTIAALAVTNAKIAAATIDLTTKVTGTLPVANGGTGTASTLTGLVRGGSPLTASELSGDVTTSGSNAATIATGAITDAKGSLANKPPARVVATSNLANSGLLTVDGVTVAAGDIVLDTAQTTTAQNGPWVAASGAWTRPTWYASANTTQAFANIVVRIDGGTLGAGSSWVQTAAAPITIDTTTTSWVVVANVPLLSTANTFAANQQISDAEPRQLFNESDQSTDLKLWDFDLNSGVFTGRTRTDADAAGKNWLSVTRGATTALTTITLGNATDAINMNFTSSAATTTNTFTGQVIAANFAPSANNAPGGGGIFKPGTNVLGFASGGGAAGQFDAVKNFLTLGGRRDGSYVKIVPTTGFTQTMANATMTLMIVPAGTLASGTVTMMLTPTDGQIVRIASSQIITTFTLSPNTSQTVLSAPTTFAAGSSVLYEYILADTTWYRLQ